MPRALLLFLLACLLAAPSLALRLPGARRWRRHVHLFARRTPPPRRAPLAEHDWETKVLANLTSVD